MASVDLEIGGHRYSVACRDGGEAHLRTIAAKVDAKVVEARAAVGNASEVRQLLFAALLLADTEDAVPAAEAPSDALDAIAERVERLADALEAQATTS